MRALAVVRLSRVTDATTSPERQLAECVKLCKQRGYELVGIAEDLDVSGSADPFNRQHRPTLARWLAGDHEPFDAIVTYRVDRLTRSIRHLQRLVTWAEDHDKIIVSATEPHFDMSSPFAAVVIALMGTVAQMELEAISERNRSAAQHNIRRGAYRGGVPAWGYVTEKGDDGWRFVQDPEQVVVIEEVVRRVLDGEPLRAIAHELTARGIPTPRDKFAIHQGREPKGFAWHSGPLKRALTSTALLGYAVSGDAPVRHDDGSPVIRAEPILTREVFERVGKELTERENRKEPTVRSTSLLVGIIFCAVCGRSAYRLKGGTGRKPRYRCASAQYRESCGNRSIPLEYADDTVEQMMIGMLGQSERLERVWDGGSDNSEELEDLNATLEDLTSLVGTGPYVRGTPQRGRLDSRIGELAARQAQLAAQATKPAGWTWVGTGEMFGDWWARQDVEARNVWLRSMGITLGFSYTPDGDGPRVHLDMGNLEQQVRELEPAGPVARWQETFAAMNEQGLAGMEIGLDGEVTFHPRVTE